MSQTRQYLTPISVEQALDYLQSYQGQAQIIAGGTDVIPDIRKGKIDPHGLVDIGQIAELNQIHVTGEFVEIGAAVTFANIKESPFLNQHVHALADAARSVGATGIQTAATWVGNIVQAMPAADGAIIAIALDAEARVVDKKGAVWVAVETLFRGPGLSAIDPTRQLITHIRFALPQMAWGTAWRRIGRRPSLVLPILNCAVKLCLDANGDKIERAAVSLGPVAPRPFRARQAEAYLRGQAPTEQAFGHAASLAQQESNPRSSIARASRDYRLSIIPSLVSDALATAAERAGASEGVLTNPPI